MTEEPHTDDSSGGDSEERESTDGSRIDEFLQRFEGDQQSTDQTTPTGDADGSPDQTRLWDRFDTGREDQPAEQPLEIEDDTEAGNDAIEGFGTDDRLSQEYTTDTHGTAADEPTGDSTEFTTDEGESTDSTDGSATAFGSILNRISHRIGGFGSESADSGGTTEATTETGTPQTGEGEPGDPGTEPTGMAGTTAGPPGAGPTGGSPHADTIDEILNNIDLFGRATSSSQVLLLSPTAHSITNDIYARFLLPTDGSGQNVLFVSATQSTSDQLSTARKIPDWREGKTAVIEVGQSALKPAQPVPEGDITGKLDIYKEISNLNHLAKLGINISHIVSQWSGNRRPTVVGVHTLSAIQQYVGNETMFQFLFTLKSQLNSMGVMGFYHMDPSVHTESEIDTIQSAFDLVIEIESDGSVEIL